MFYGCLITPLWILFVVMYVMAGSFYKASEDGLIAFCDPAVEPVPEVQNLFQKYVDDIDSNIVAMTNKWMCSRQCPCRSSDKAIYQNAYTQSQANSYGRTWNPNDSNDADGTVYMYFPSESDASNDYFPVTFYDCYFEWKSAWESETGGTYGQTPTDWSTAA